MRDRCGYFARDWINSMVWSQHGLVLEGKHTALRCTMIRLTHTMMVISVAYAVPCGMPLFHLYRWLYSVLMIEYCCLYLLNVILNWGYMFKYNYWFNVLVDWFEMTALFLSSVCNIIRFNTSWLLCDYYLRYT